VKTGFTTLVNKRAHIIYTPCFLYRYALASKAFPEHLRIVLKHVTERVNVIRAQAHFFKLLYEDELIGLQCERMLKECFLPN